MQYNDGTGDYINDFMESILDTDFRYGVPYKISREKYRTILQKYGERQRIVDADVVTFSTSLYYSGHRDASLEDLADHYTFFAWPENSPKGSKDFYECIQFLCGEDRKEKYESFIHDIISCIIGIDAEYLEKIKSQKQKEISDISAEVSKIDDILKNI